MKVICVVGARPNFMKIKPVLDALEQIGGATLLVHTGQHYDAEMSEVFLRELRIRPPDRNLGAGSGTHAMQTARVMEAFEPIVAAEQPDAVVVVGDVNSTMACAIVAAKAGPLVAHVEAGLRSRDWSMPEEINRVVTDRVSDLLFAPSPDAVRNLQSEGYRDDQIHFVGNVMVDTLLANVERARARPIHHDLGLMDEPYGVVTLHRPANVDDAATLDALLSAFGSLSIRLILPVHPRVRVRLEKLDVPSNVQLCGPLGYLDFVCLQASARVVLTDSGGVQEETTALGVPCVTLRENTERPITISEGTNTLAGTNPRAIASTVEAVLHNPRPPRRPELWDGSAGSRVADALSLAVGSRRFPRPTETHAR